MERPKTEAGWPLTFAGAGRGVVSGICFSIRDRSDGDEKAMSGFEARSELTATVGLVSELPLWLSGVGGRGFFSHKDIDFILFHRSPPNG
jgi:hypothetical protein